MFFPSIFLGEFFSSYTKAGDENNLTCNPCYGCYINSEIPNYVDDISYLIFPSISRALELNKAYKVIVEEQSFIYGCAGHIQPLKNVYEELEEVKPTGLEVIRRVE